MDWQNIYKSRCCTPEQAISQIKSGNRVVVGHACGSPELLLKTMVDHKEAYERVELVHMVSMGESLYCLPENADHFAHHSFFTGATTREAINSGRGCFTPVHFSQIPGLFKNRILPVDVTLCMLSPPDEEGYCSFGVSVDYTLPAAENSRIVIAEVTPHMPRTLGQSVIHVSKIDCIVESNSRPIILQPPKITHVEEAIGSHCAELIKDGDCLQLGIGGIPDAVLGFLKEKKDLGIHTEMFSDGVVDLYNKGVVTCKRKNFHLGKMVATFFMGTEKLYRFIDNNPIVEMFPVDYTNNPAIIAQNDNMVSLNSALQVDLQGQVVSDTIGYNQFSGTGGQADFVRGAMWSKNGRSILAFQSTAASGRISRIVPHIDEGAAVVTNRADVHYIVTEHGIADLRGRTIHERAKALINIAHPDFRGDLRKGRFFVNGFEKNDEFPTAQVTTQISKTR